MKRLENGSKQEGFQLIDPSRLFLRGISEGTKNLDPQKTIIRSKFSAMVASAHNF